MRFTLTYEGVLPSNGTASAKHEIRRALHPQLKALWNYLPLSDHLAWVQSRPPVDDSSFLRKVDSYDFASVVHSSQKLFAELDILLLKAEAPGSIIIMAGDIDNKLKTLFDALRMPNQKQEIPGDWCPGVEEQPLHCLLEDDRLITRVNVDTDRLLTSVANQDEVKLTIRVTIRGHTATWGNLGLIS